MLVNLPLFVSNLSVFLLNLIVVPLPLQLKFLIPGHLLIQKLLLVNVVSAQLVNGTLHIIILVLGEL